MTNQNFAIFEGIILLVIVFEFAFLPLLLEKMPDSLINLPNKEFWLANEKRAETFAVMRRYFEWFSVMLLALFIAVNQLVFTANLKRENLPGTAMWLILGSFLIFAAFWMIKFIRQFKIKK